MGIRQICLYIGSSNKNGKEAEGSGGLGSSFQNEHQVVVEDVDDSLQEES